MSTPAPYPSDLYPGCPCYRCDSKSWPISPGLGIPMARMSLCPTCGNKRCPGAVDHDNECSGSNEPGQKGSAYDFSDQPVPSWRTHLPADATPEQIGKAFLDSLPVPSPVPGVCHPQCVYGPGRDHDGSSEYRCIDFDGNKLPFPGEPGYQDSVFVPKNRASAARLVRGPVLESGVQKVQTRVRTPLIADSDPGAPGVPGEDGAVLRTREGGRAADADGA